MSETAPAVPTPAPAAPAAPAAVASPAAPEAAPAPDSAAMARTLAGFAQREIALTKERQRLAAERDQHKSELETAKQRAARLDRIEQLKASDPIAALKELGLDYSTLTKAQLNANPEAPVKRADLESWKKEVETQNQARDAEARKAAEEAKRAQDQTRYEQAYAQHSQAAEAHIEGAAEKYEVLRETWREIVPGAPSMGDVVLGYIQSDYDRRRAGGEENVKPLAMDVAIDRLNEHAEAKAERAAAAIAKKKARGSAAPAAPAEAPVAAPAKKAVAPEVKPPVDTGAAVVDDDPKPLYDPDNESTQQWLRRLRKWEERHKAT